MTVQRSDETADRRRIRLRNAEMNDLPLLKRWDEQPHVIASDPNDDWEWETELGRTPSWREQLIAEADGRPIGFVQIIDPHEEESHYWGAIGPGYRAVDIWIGEPEALGKGYGTEMMRQALDRCFADPGVLAVVIDPLSENSDAIRFYRRLGFRFVEFRSFGADHCAVHRIDRDQWSGVSDKREG